MFVERRMSAREALALPLELDECSTALTRNICAAGLYLEVDGKYEAEGFVLFEIHHAAITATVEGEIMRLEYREGNTGLALKFRRLLLEPDGLAN